MKRAVIFNDGKSFAEIAVEGDGVYEKNVARSQDFIIPIIVPNDLKASDVLGALNSGKKRILKTGVDHLGIEHKKLSKR